MAVLDDLFPYGASAFREAELSYILRHIPDSVVCTTLASLDWLGLGHEREAILARWRGDNVDIATGLRVIGGPEELPSADLYYTLFLNNAHALLPVVRARRIPFAFTLYPGGGLAFNASAAVRLREVFAQPLLARVVITQPAVPEYVISNQLVSPSKIEYIFGIALGPDDSPEPTRVSGPPSLAFVAHRSHPKGHDKGLDLFVAACERLLNAGLPLTAHIIGPWRRTDLDSVRDPSRYVLHGALGSHDLQLLLRSIEIAVFPTRQGILCERGFRRVPNGVGDRGWACRCGRPLNEPPRSGHPVEAGTRLRADRGHRGVHPRSAGASRRQPRRAPADSGRRSACDACAVFRGRPAVATREDA